MTRNRLDVIGKYAYKFPMFSLKELKAIIFEYIKIILFEKDKMQKNKAIFKGIKDYINSKFGQYNG